MYRACDNNNCHDLINKCCEAVLNHDNILAKNIFQYIYFNTDILCKDIHPDREKSNEYNAIKASIVEYMDVWYKHYSKTYETPLKRLYNEDKLPVWINSNEYINLTPCYYWGIPPKGSENKTFLKRNIYIWKGDFDFI